MRSSRVLSSPDATCDHARSSGLSEIRDEESKVSRTKKTRHTLAMASVATWNALSEPALAAQHSWHRLHDHKSIAQVLGSVPFVSFRNGARQERAGENGRWPEGPSTTFGHFPALAIAIWAVVGALVTAITGVAGAQEDEIISLDRGWRLIGTSDPMEDTVRWRAVGRATQPLRKISSILYDQLTARLVFSRGPKGDEVVGVLFNQPLVLDTVLNLFDPLGMSGISVRTKWDGHLIEEEMVAPDIMGQGIAWKPDAALGAIGRIRDSTELLFEVPLVDAGKPVFRFDLSGSSNAIDMARNKCGGAS